MRTFFAKLTDPPSKPGVVGSNPAGRANSIFIPALKDRSRTQRHECAPGRHLRLYRAP